MTRPETTKFLSDLLVRRRLSGMGRYYASEVTIDYGTNTARRIDFLQFTPQNSVNVSSIEKGYFTVYEIKSCIEDFYSGNGLNFIGEKNYIVTTMDCYKKLLDDLDSDKLKEHIKSCNPEASTRFGVIVAIPDERDLYDEFDCPTDLDAAEQWKLRIIRNDFGSERKRSITELLFCMLRSGK